MARWKPEPVMIGAGSTKLALFRRRAGKVPSGGELKITEGWRRVAWATDRAGFHAAQKHLASLGIRFEGPQDHGRSQSIYFADPDGNPLEVTWYVGGGGLSQP
jgi:catechol 2,3-dioxygenase-like lactoylglutathione lyase family enzyme